MFLKPTLKLIGQISNHHVLLQTQNHIRPPNFLITSAFRFLYTEEALGMDSYRDSRQKASIQFEGLKDKFYQKMTEFSDPQSPNMVFTEDLKNILHLAGPDDLELVTKMLLKFNSQNKDLRFGSYVFGPVVMRFLHYLNKPNEALDLFLNEEFTSFFAQNISYQVLLDILFKNEKFEDVVKAFDVIESRQNQGTRYPKTVVILYVAALYKINTPEAFERACQLYRKLNEVGHAHIRRAVCFATALAINQNHFNEAMELLALMSGQSNYVTIRNLKLLALVGLKRFDDALAILNNILQADVPEASLNTKQSIFSDVIAKLQSEIDLNNDIELKANFAKLGKQLKEFNHINSETLNSNLVQRIAKEIRYDDNGPNNFTRTRYNADGSSGIGRQSNRRPFRRPGLADLQ